MYKLLFLNFFKHAVQLMSRLHDVFEQNYESLKLGFAY